VDIDSQKDLMREAARLRRRDLAKSAGLGFGGALVDFFFADFDLAAGSKIAGYWPITREADVKPLLGKLAEKSVICLLPVVIARDTALVFREWQPGDELAPSDLDIPEPTIDKSVGIPEFLLVPLLAFDRQGYRLGYGGGYYDRTLQDLRATRDITAIGIAYQGQEVDSVPHESFDQRLDGVITEAGVTRFNQN
jgi:5-formyltetrahydrofolate cyclo-ligase